MLFITLSPFPRDHSRGILIKIYVEMLVKVPIFQINVFTLFIIATGSPVLLTFVRINRMRLVTRKR